MKKYSGRTITYPLREGETCFSSEGTYAFTAEGDRVWARSEIADQKLKMGKWTETILVTVCGRCGTEINQVRDGRFPGLGVCDECFAKHCDAACICTPATLLNAQVGGKPERYATALTVVEAGGLDAAREADVLGDQSLLDDPAALFERLGIRGDK